MKAKKKFDPKVIQQFFIDHTEKFVIGLVGLLFLYFTYDSVTQLPPYNERPEKLKADIDRANAKILSGPATPNLPTFPPYGDLIDQFKTLVNSGEYPMPYPPYWKPFKPLRLARRRRSSRSSICGPYPGEVRFPKTAEAARANAGSWSRGSFRTRGNWPSTATNS